MAHNQSNQGVLWWIFTQILTFCADVDGFIHACVCNRWFCPWAWCHPKWAGGGSSILSKCYVNEWKLRTLQKRVICSQSIYVGKPVQHIPTKIILSTAQHVYAMTFSKKKPACLLDFSVIKYFKILGDNIHNHIVAFIWPCLAFLRLRANSRKSCTI